MRCPSCGYTNARKQQSIEAKIIFKDIPEDLRNAFIAAEDSNFFTIVDSL